MLGTFNSPVSPLRAWLFAFVMVLALVATPLTVLSQTEVPAAETVEEAPPADAPAAEPPAVAEPAVEEPVVEAHLPAQTAPEEPVQQAPAPPSTGSLEVRLTAPDGGWLSGHFAVTDAAGNYHERWTESGVAWFSDLVAGTATVHQLGGTTDFWFDSADPDYIDVPADGHATQPIVNAFLDDDNDGVGNSVDICGAGNDALDTDADGTPDACDATPTGDDDADGVDNATDACTTGDDAIDTDADGTADACDNTPEGETPTEIPAPETSALVAGVATEPVVVEGALVSCDQLAGLNPTLASDGAEFAPGAMVTLTGAGWAPGQLVTIVVDDDGTIDADQGDWTHSAEATADETGAFTHELTLPADVAASYRAVATGQCSAAPVEMAEIVAEVAAEPEVVAEAPVTCQQADAVTPFIATDLADYPPGSTVTLTGGNWVAGQTIEILVEDDGIADAERGPWSHAATVTADEGGAFTHQFDIAPWFVADYNVVATGECSKAETSFKDGNVLVAVSGPTSASIAWRYDDNSTTCVNNSGSNNTTANATGVTIRDVPLGDSIRLTAPNNIPGLTFLNWTKGETTQTDMQICVEGDSSAQTWTANYGIAGNVYVKTSGTAAATIDWRKFGNNGCGGSANSNGTTTANNSGVPALTTTASESNRAFELTARPVTGATFSYWTRQGSQTQLTDATICFSGMTNAQVWTANYIPAVVSRPTTTGLTLVAGTNPSTSGQSVTFQASVTATAGNPSGAGSVTFLDGTTPLCNAVPLTTGTNTADCTTTALALGSRSITAVYSGYTDGSPQFDGSTSSALPHTVDEPPPTAANLLLSCNPNPASPNAGQPVTVNCTYSGLSTLGTRQVTLTQVTVPAPSGWSISSTVGTVSGQTLTISPTSANTISFNPVQNYTFSYTLTPSCTASTTTQTMALTSQFTFNGGSATTGATFNGQVARSNTSSPLAFTMQNPPDALGWTQPVSFTGNTVSGSIVYRVTSTGCNGWSAQISATNFVYSGANNGTAISNANLLLTSAGAPTGVNGASTTGVSAQTTSGAMSAAITVLAATPGNGNGQYDQQLGFSVQIPANSRAGTYTSTITIASGTGP